MNTQDFYSNVEDIMRDWLPNNENKSIWQNIISPHRIELPESILSRAKELIKNIYELKNNKNYTKKTLSKSGFDTQPHNSVLMAYDFHFKNEDLKLIEVNTNASGFLLSHLAYRAQDINNDQSLDLLKNSFEEEFNLFYKKPAKHLNIAIIDESPEEQKMYIEFLMYKKLFESWGWQTKIQDYAEPIDKFDIIYNRYCDFEFSDPSSDHLKKAYINKEMCFTPHPVEYILFAHKDRFIDWTEEEFPIPDKLKQMIPSTKLITSFTDSDELWRKRKHLFFKPRFLYGGKAVYNGKSISRKMFDKISNDSNFLAQETCLPGKITFNNEDWKYDLRFYVYKNNIQQVIARIYQGQVTNFNSKNGGFCPVIFS